MRDQRRSDREYVDGLFQPVGHGKGEPLARLLTHAALHMPDRAVRDDWECVVPLARTEDDVKALRRYRSARMSAVNFQGHSWTANNHNRIPMYRMEMVAPARLTEIRCAGCGSSFVARRNDARSCSPRCRKRAERLSQINGSEAGSHTTTPARPNG